MDPIYQPLLSSSVLWSSAALLLLFYLVSPSKGRRSSFPTVKKPRQGEDIRPLLLENAKKFGDRIYRLPMDDHETIVIPPKYIPDLVSRPEHELSFNRELAVRLLGKYTTIGQGAATTNFGAPLIRVDLSRHLDAILPILQDEIEKSTTKRIGAAEEWIALPLAPTMLKIVGQVTSRIFVGEDLCRNDQWLDFLISYAQLAVIGSGALQKYPNWTYPFVAPFVPEVQDIYRAVKAGKAMLWPVLKERQERMKNEPDWTPPEDFVTWVAQGSKNGWDPSKHIQAQMGIGLASLHTSSSLLINTLLDLCVNPSLIPILREEYTSVQSSGQDMRHMLSSMRKMDSAMRESLRMHPTLTFGITRHVGTDIRLSDGIVIPKNTHIAVPEYVMNFDPQVYDKPEIYDGLRFEKIREEARRTGNAQKETRAQLTSTSTEFVAFGHGKHACPGRFFATNEVKMILGHLLTEYDFKLEHPEAGRPKSRMTKANISPDPKARLLFRKRRETSS